MSIIFGSYQESLNILEEVLQQYQAEAEQNPIANQTYEIKQSCLNYLRDRITRKLLQEQDAYENHYVGESTETIGGEN